MATGIDRRGQLTESAESVRADDREMKSHREPTRTCSWESPIGRVVRRLCG